MAKKKRPPRALRSASKVQEAELLEQVRALRDEPEHVVPECDGSCVLFCPFKAARRRAAKAIAAADDPERLKGLAKRGNRIGRALAAALLAAKADSISHLASARLPFGTFPYIYRGNVKPIFHVAAQHWPDRRLRLLGAAELARRRGLVVYATEEGLVCTHRRFAPPPGFVDLEVEALGLGRREEGLHTCPHPGARPALALEWLSAGVTLRICGACATERNSMHRILEHMFARDAPRDFSVAAELLPIEGLPDAEAADEGAILRYKRGEIGDRAFLEAAEEARLAALRKRSGFLLVAGSRAHADAGSLADAAGASAPERKALEAALLGWSSPIVVPRASVALVLEAVWAERGEAALAAAAGSKVVAARLYEAEAGAAEIADLLRRAAEEGGSERVSKALPKYGPLPETAALADRAARAYRAKGKEEATRLVADAGAPEGPMRGVALALLSALGEDKGHAWKFSGLDREVADYIADEAKTLLFGDPARYHDALASLSAKTGGGDVPPPR